MARHARFSESSRSIEEMDSRKEQQWTAQGNDGIDRYPGDDILLAFEYRLACQVIACHRDALLEEALETTVPGPDTPVGQLARRVEAPDAKEYQSAEQFCEFVETLIGLACEHEADA